MLTGRPSIAWNSTPVAERQAILNYDRIAAQWGRSLTQLALQFVLSTSGVSVVLLGMRTAEHVAANLGCLTVPALSSSELSTLRSLWWRRLARGRLAMSYSKQGGKLVQFGDHVAGQVGEVG